MGDKRDGSPGTASGDSLSLDVLPLHSTNLLTLLDENGVIQYETPSIERIYGFDQDELVGEQVADYFHPEDREAVLEAFRTVVESEEYTVQSVEYRHRKADDSYVWVESVASADPTPQGYYVVNSRDISEQKQREKRLEDTNTRLEEFATLVSHDLRNPLTIAQSRLELAREECDSDHLDSIDDAHRRMDTLMEHLLTLARAGRQTGQKERIDLEELAETCWQTVATSDADLVVDIDRRLRGDRQRVAQLLENLFRNAVEHGSTSPDSQAPRDPAEHAGADVTITVGELADGFYVADDGPGIPAAEHEQVFDLGYTTTEDGTGFGLGIVRHVVDGHDWRIDVTDSSDGGARFEITDVDFE